MKIERVKKENNFGNRVEKKRRIKGVDFRQHKTMEEGVKYRGLETLICQVANEKGLQGYSRQGVTKTFAFVKTVLGQVPSCKHILTLILTLAKTLRGKH